MSTPFRLPAPPGGAVHGAVRTADARRPAVVLCDGTEPLALRLARAGFTVVSFGGGDAELGLVLGATRGGALSIEPSAVGLFGRAAGGSVAVRRAAGDPAVRALVTWAAPADALRAAAQVRVPWLALDAAVTDDEALAATVGWFSRHLAP